MRNRRMGCMAETMGAADGRSVAFEQAYGAGGNTLAASDEAEAFGGLALDIDLAGVDVEQFGDAIDLGLGELVKEPVE